MLVIVGYLIVMVCVFGGYMFEGGSMLALMQPFEFMIIAGAALGTFVIANNPKVIRASFVGAISVLKLSHYSKDFYIQLLSLFFELTNKIRRDGVLAIENEIENPKEGAIFSKYPLVNRDPRLMEYICDHLRLIITGRVDPQHLELLMDEDIETLELEGELPINAITKVADSLPAFGIVAAVMGVVITMQMIDSPPDVLGEHVAKALVGTFLGVLLGYGFIAPVASSLETRLQAEIRVFQSIKVVLLASVHNMAPTIAVEFARKVLYSSERPTSRQLEDLLRDVRSGGKSAPNTPDAKK